MGFKSGFVGVLGQSQRRQVELINALMGKKLLIVSEAPVHAPSHPVQCVLTLPGAPASL
jgi:GTPase Era involved in 16S rRNA processing